jgi:basic membrane protein A and related proteins
LRIQTVFGVVVMLCASLSACSSKSLDCTREDVFCTALVTDTRGLHDFGLTQDTWAGLQQAKADGLVDQIANIESVDAKDYEKNIAYFVKAGYDVIVTSNAGMQAATLHSADLYLHSVFIGINQTDEESKPNFISVTFPEDRMGFLAGALAAQLTRTRIIGAVCEASGIDAMWRYCEGFRAGAQYIDDTLKIMVMYRDDGSREKLFIDPDWGAINAETLVQSGADVIFAVGGETAVGAIQAATTAKIRVIGAERDQAAALGDQGSSVVTSLLGRASFTVQSLMRNVKAGNFADSNESPVEYLSIDQIVPQNIATKLAEIAQGLETGAIKTNVTNKKP